MISLKGRQYKSNVDAGQKMSKEPIHVRDSPQIDSIDLVEDLVAQSCNKHMNAFVDQLI